MIFTINAVLTSLANQLASGDLDDSLKDLLEVIFLFIYKSIFFLYIEIVFIVTISFPRYA